MHTNLKGVKVISLCFSNFFENTCTKYIFLNLLQKLLFLVTGNFKNDKMHLTDLKLFISA